MGSQRRDYWFQLVLFFGYGVFLANRVDFELFCLIVSSNFIIFGS